MVTVCLSRSVVAHVAVPALLDAAGAAAAGPPSSFPVLAAALFRIRLRLDLRPDLC